MSSPCNSVGGPGTRYTFAELEGLWVNAGGPSALAPTMAAVALAESGGCSTNENTTDNGGTQTSWGLWQISNGTHSVPGPNWSTGAGNAALAVAKWKSQGLGAWGTYTTGAYKAFLNGNPPAPDTSVNGGASGGGAAATAATLTAANPDCLVSFPSGKVLFLTVGGQCIITKSEARGAAGAVILLNGGLIMLAGVVILAAYGLKSTAAREVAGTLAGAASKAAGRPVKPPAYGSGPGSAVAAPVRVRRGGQGQAAAASQAMPKAPRKPRATSPASGP
jgi:Lysozyme like domain